MKRGFQSGTGYGSEVIDAPSLAGGRETLIKQISFVERLTQIFTRVTPALVISVSAGERPGIQFD